MRDGVDPAERDAWAILATIHGLGPVAFAALLARFGSAAAILEAAGEPGGVGRIAATRGAEGIEPIRRQAIGPDLARSIADVAGQGPRIVGTIRALGLATVTLEDPTYPRRLLSLEMPPHVLFVRGSIAAVDPAHPVAVVGTRHPTEAGRRVSGEIAGAVTRAGGVVVSGLAVGIDGAAHAAAAEAGAPTVAVLGSGHDRLYPRAHVRLAEKIVSSGGAVVSELAPGYEATRGTFPRRNRLISGLADATVVVEAGHRSGALVTADWALEQGRECFVVPGPLHAPASAGCLAFLRAYPGQARIVAGVAELIEDLGLGEAARGEGAGASSDGAAGRGDGPAGGEPSERARWLALDLGPVERCLLERLERGPATVDDLVVAAAVPVAAVLGALTLLEIRGLASGAYGRYHAVTQPARRSA